MASVGLRVRIALVAALTVGVALAASALVLVGVLRGRLDEAATTAAELRARDIGALVAAGALPANLALPGEESAFVQVVAEQGTVVASTGNIEGESPVSTRRPTGARPLVMTQTIDPLDDGAKMRVAVLDVRVGDEVLTVYAGESLENVSSTTATLAMLLALGVPMLTVLAAAVTWWAVGRTLRPVREISRTMSEITASDLHRRVPAPAVADEIGELAATVNATLARLDESVETQRRFVADASHELRGPLAALRADLEISVTHPERTDWRVVARDTLGDVERLQQLTDDLLMLARLGAGHISRDQEVDLVDVIEEVLRQVRRAGLVVERAGLDHPVVVMGEPDQLHRLIRNVIHNAEQHADGRIRVDLSSHLDVVRVTVDDDGPGIPPDLRSSVFERFTRLDSARTRDAGGTGLGLAIAAEVAESHRGSVVAVDGALGGATFVVELPWRRVPDGGAA